MSQKQHYLVWEVTMCLMASTFSETEPGLKHLALILHCRSEPKCVCFFSFRFSDANYEALKAKWLISANAFKWHANSLVSVFSLCMFIGSLMNCWCWSDRHFDAHFLTLLSFDLFIWSPKWLLKASCIASGSMSRCKSMKN